MSIHNYHFQILNNSCLRRTLIMIMIPVSISIALKQTPSTSLSFIRISYFPNCKSSRQSTYEVSYHRKIHEVSLCESFCVHSPSKNASLDSTVSDILKTCDKFICSTGLERFVCFEKNILSSLQSLHSVHFGLLRTNKAVPSKKLSTVRGLLHVDRIFSNEVVKIIIFY